MFKKKKKAVQEKLAAYQSRLKMKNVLRELSEKTGQSPKEIYAEMQAAIDHGFNTCDNPIGLEIWASIPCKGERPTVEEFLEYESKKHFPEDL